MSRVESALESALALLIPSCLRGMSGRGPGSAGSPQGRAVGEKRAPEVGGWSPRTVLESASPRSDVDENWSHRRYLTPPKCGVNGLPISPKPMKARALRGANHTCCAAFPFGLRARFSDAPHRPSIALPQSWPHRRPHGYFASLRLGGSPPRMGSQGESIAAPNARGLRKRRRPRLGYEGAHKAHGEAAGFGSFHATCATNGGGGCTAERPVEGRRMVEKVQISGRSLHVLGKPGILVFSFSRFFCA